MEKKKAAKTEKKAEKGMSRTEFAEEYSIETGRQPEKAGKAKKTEKTR